MDLLQSLDQTSVGADIDNLVGGLFVIAKASPDVDPDQITQTVDAAFDASAENDPLLGAWQHEVVTDGDWLAINAVPPTTSLAAVPEDLLASDEVYQWVRSGFTQDGTNVYMNLQAIENAFGSEFVSEDEMPLLSAFRALGISVQTESGGDAHARMTVLIGS